MTALAAPWRGIRAYAAHDDPRAAAANMVALIVAANQPFYPLYLAWILDGPVWPSFLTFLSTPFFLAVPFVARRNTLAGRALLVVAGIANTVLSAAAFGVASGVELFLIPCAALAALLFRPKERAVAFALMAVALAAFLVLHGRYGEPLVRYSAEDYAAFLSLNALSVGGLTVFIGLTVSGMMAKLEG